MTQPEYITVIQQIQALRRSIDLTSHNISDTTMHLRHPKYNSLLWDEAKLCRAQNLDQSLEHHFSLDLKNFIERLVDNELDVIHQCFIKFQNIVNTIGKD